MRPADRCRAVRRRQLDRVCHHVARAFERPDRALGAPAVRRRRASPPPACSAAASNGTGRLGRAAVSRHPAGTTGPPRPPAWVHTGGHAGAGPPATLPTAHGRRNGTGLQFVL